MGIVNENFSITRGDTYTYNLTFFNESSRLDLSNYTIRFTVKSSLDDNDSSAIIQVLGSNVSATDGTGKFVLTKSHTDSLTAGNYYYDIQIDSVTDGNIKTVRNGIITVIDDVTRTSYA